MFKKKSSKGVKNFNSKVNRHDPLMFIGGGLRKKGLPLPKLNPNDLPWCGGW